MGKYDACDENRIWVPDQSKEINLEPYKYLEYANRWEIRFKDISAELSEPIAILIRLDDEVRSNNKKVFISSRETYEFDSVYTNQLRIVIERLETDEEMEKRLNHQKQDDEIIKRNKDRDKEKAEKQKLKAEEDEKKLYEKLKRKFEDKG